MAFFFRRMLTRLLPSALVMSLFPAMAQDSPAWRMARNLGRGTCLSWLEHYWDGEAMFDSTAIADRESDIQLMRELGFTVVRVPVTFNFWAETEFPYRINPAIWQPVDSLMEMADRHGLRLILDYQHDDGRLAAHPEQEFQRLLAIWEQIARRYAHTDPDKVLFELFNEPTLDTAIWQGLAEKLVQHIRFFAPAHTLVAGGCDWNSLNGLTALKPLTDNNILYTFHCYTPFLFTHQGAPWLGEAMTTTGVSFPYEGHLPPLHPAAAKTWGKYAWEQYPATATKDSLYALISTGKKWSQRHNVPVYCGEFGSYKHAAPDDGSRCRYYAIMREILESLAIPYTFWDWEEGFSLFRPDATGRTKEDLDSCLLHAMQLGQKAP